MNVEIRKIHREEITWINNKYAEVEFPKSNFDNEFIAIAEINNEKVGLEVSEKILKKYKWCNNIFDEKVLLLSL